MALIKINLAQGVTGNINLASNVTGTLPVANGGTALTSGFVNGGALTNVDQWRITTEFTGNASPINSNWERNDDLFGVTGSGMSHSSGAWTFPATGQYLIIFTFIHQFDQADAYTLFDIEGCSDGSSFNRIGRHHMGGDGGYHRTGYCNAVFNCNNTSTHLVRFTISDANASNSTKGSTGEQQTGATFIKLA